MKAITLWQPWASLVALGLKKYETRSWPTTYRGPIAIHAAKRWYYASEGLRMYRAIELAEKNGQFDRRRLPNDLPFGAVVAIARIESCEEMNLIECPGFIGINTISEIEKIVGDWRPGRFAWKLEDVQAIEPVFMNGRQGLWNCELDLEVSLEGPV